MHASGDLLPVPDPARARRHPPVGGDEDRQRSRIRRTPSCLGGVV